MKKTLIFLFIISLWILLFSLNLNASNIVVINRSLESINFGKNIEYVRDNSTKQSFDDIISDKNKWIQSDSDSLNFGFTPAAYWFRFTVDNTTGKEYSWFFELSYPMLDFIELYIPDSDGKYTVKKSGDRYSFNEREIKDRNFIFHLFSFPGRQTYYLRIETTSSMNFLPIMWSNSAFLNRANVELPMFWMYYGLLLVMAIYNLFMFFSIRERSYIYYSIFIFSWILFQLTLNGFAFQYLWQDQTWWGNNCLPFFMCFTCSWVVLFISSYIEVKTNFPRIYRFMNFFQLAPMAIWSLASLSGNYRLSITVATGLTIYFTISMYIVVIYTYNKGSRPARFLLLGFVFLVIGLLLYTLKTFGILPTNLLTNWGLQFGIALLVVLLSLGLSDKINVMKIQLQELNLTLEDKVEKRTEELNAANQELEAMNESLLMINQRIEEAHRIQQQDMQLAYTIQSAFMPKDVPSSDDYDVAYIFNPMANVSGDFYDFYVNNNVLSGIGLFDVSGHGISSGLITLIAKSIIYRNFEIMHSEKLGNVMEKINQELIAEIGNVDNYLTGILLRFANGNIEYVNAGHPDLLYKSSKTKNVTKILDSSGETIRGDFLGIIGMENTYRTITLKINKGDTLFLFTDCMLEAKNTDEKEFEIEGVIKSFKNSPDSSVQDILNYILEEFYNFVPNKNKLSDDLTAIVIRRK